MLQLKKLIGDKLGEIAIAYNKIHYNILPDLTKFPQIIFNIPNSLDKENNEFVEIEIDIWTASTSAGQILQENLAVLIDNILNKFKYIDNNMQTSIFRQDGYMLNLPDPDPKILRKKLKYVAKTYFLN